MPTTTPPWAPEPVTGRDLLRVHRRWPTTTLYVTAVGVLFAVLCWVGATR